MSPCLSDAGFLFYLGQKYWFQLAEKSLSVIIFLYMKRSEAFFSIIQIPLDYLAIIAAALAAYFVRFSGYALTIRPATAAVAFNTFVQVSLILAAAWILIFSAYGLYAIGRPRKLTDELGRIIGACTFGVMLAILAIFFRREFFASRFIVLAAWGFSVLFVFFARLFLRACRRLLLRSGVGIHRLVLVGAGKNAETLLREFAAHPALGFRVEKVFADFNADVKKEIFDLRIADKIDEIFFTKAGATRSEIIELNDFASDARLPLKYTSDPYAAETALTDIAIVSGVPVVEIKKTRLDGWGRIYKRFFDFIFALLFIIILSPVFLLVAILIKLTSRGPVIYLNERVGDEGKLLNVFKFRTMYSKYCVGRQFGHEAEALEFEQKLIGVRGIKSGPVYKIKNDPRITPLGRILRRTSFDELPQLCNVLIGNMSFVGPRPHQPREVEKYARHQLQVLNIKPGITGMAQVSGRSDLDFEDEVRLDTYYLENWSLALDLYIILKTPFVVLNGRGSY